MMCFWTVEATGYNIPLPLYFCICTPNAITPKHSIRHSLRKAEDINQ
jgi:hypothetical protein